MTITASRLFTRLAGVAAVAALVVPLAACQVDSDAPESKASDDPSAPAIPEVQKVDSIAKLLPADIKKSGTLRIVMTTSSPPAHFTTENGLEGLDHDLGVLIGEVLGVKTEFIGVPIDQVIPGFESGKYDLVVSQFTPSPERAEVLDFVDYAQSGTSLVIKSETEDLDIDSMCGHKIGAQKGSVQATDRLPDYDKKCTDAGDPATVANTFRDTTEALLALRSGRVDGVLADTPVLGYAVKQSDGKLKLAGNQPGEPVSAGTVKGNGLDKPVQAAIQELSDNGAYSTVFENWGMKDSEIDDFAINNIQDN